MRAHPLQRLAFGLAVALLAIAAFVNILPL